MPHLHLTPEEFRRMAEQITEFCSEYLEGLDTRPSFPATSGGETAALFAGPLPEKGMREKALDAMAGIAAHSRPAGPRFFGYVFGSGEPVGALGDYFASVLNQNVTAWRSAPAAVTIERTVIGWLAEAINCAGFSGSLCGGGSAANTMALAMAREAKLPANENGAQPGVVYASTEVHMSIPKAVALLGLGRKNLRTVSVDRDLRMDVAALERAIAEDVAAGRKPIAVVATAGTVVTGAIDPLDAIAGICENHGLWLHVDGAFGALAAIAIGEQFAGLERADSLSLDPHKWLYQPADCGCLLFKDAGWARVAFSHSGEYVRSLTDDPVEGFASFEESMELSRRFRALKLWLSLRFHGFAEFRAAIADDLAHARRLEQQIQRQAALELLSTGPLSAVCFRYIGEPKRAEDELDKLNAAILQRVVRGRRRVYISNAMIHGNFALRACFVNHRTSEQDVAMVVEEVMAAAREV